MLTQGFHLLNGGELMGQIIIVNCTCYDDLQRQVTHHGKWGV